MYTQEMEATLEQYRAAVSNARSEEEMQGLYSQILGKNGWIRKLMGNIKNFEGEEKKEYGQVVNSLKEELSALIAQRQQELVEKSILDTEEQGFEVDLTMPVESREKGMMHPLSIIEQSIIKTFTGLGFTVVTGPEMETDHYNFQALNIPEDHPARDMQDTFWLSNNRLLRTHTSPCQVRAMEKLGAPLRIIAPGRVFRNETSDASHENTFHQLEGLVIDENISIANLIYVMKTLLSEVFEKNVKVRLRPGYFPFVEPGFELDLNCLICDGAGCQTCKHTGWIELVPCGMVHRNVLTMGGIDPDKYSGFAFGLGLSRLVMMKYNIPDVRMINRGDVRELEPFKTII
jgi:phenylalanyl-tRNA synthetase alpha chain